MFGALPRSGKLISEESGPMWQGRESEDALATGTRLALSTPSNIHGVWGQGRGGVWPWSSTNLYVRVRQDERVSFRAKWASDKLFYLCVFGVECFFLMT